jgi:hypothetical protein
VTTTGDNDNVVGVTVVAVTAEVVKPLDVKTFELSTPTPFGKYVFGITFSFQEYPI